MPLIAVIVFIVAAVLTVGNSNASSLRQFDFFWIWFDGLVTILFYPMLLMANAMCKVKQESTPDDEEPAAPSR